MADPAHPESLGSAVCVLERHWMLVRVGVLRRGAYVTSSGDFVTMAERWNGSAWSTQPTPNPAGALGDFLFAVTCPSSSACTALGYSHGSGTPLTMAQRWDGARWLLQPTPNPTGAAESAFGGIACPARSACFAAGSGASAALVERWNGTACRTSLPGKGRSALRFVVPARERDSGTSPTERGC